jgi:hypothetical protein
MSPDGQPSGATRIEADPSINRGEKLMRKASIRLAMLGLAVAALGLPVAAGAAPSVTVKVKVLPILKNLSNPKAGFWPHTGNFFGAPAALETKLTIKGTEYGGFPAPIRKVAVWLPKGTGIHTAGFPTCALSTLQAKEPEKCRPGSLASPAGHAPQSAPESCPSPPLAGGAGEACGVISLGKSRVHEAVKIQAYFAPGGGLNFYVEGVTPASIEIPVTGAFQSASGLFGRKFVSEVPLIETFKCEANEIAENKCFTDGVAETVSVTIGAAMMKGKKLISLGTIPKKCPSKSGFPGKGEIWFGAGPESTWEKVTITTKVPCPKK